MGLREIKNWLMNFSQFFLYIHCRSIWSYTLNKWGWFLSPLSSNFLVAGLMAQSRANFSSRANSRSSATRTKADFVTPDSLAALESRWLRESLMWIWILRDLNEFWEAISGTFRNWHLQRDRLGFPILLDPGVGSEAQEILMTPICALPSTPDFFMISMDHTNRAPGEFCFLFILHNNLTIKTGLLLEHS